MRSENAGVKTKKRKILTISSQETKRKKVERKENFMI